MWIRQELKLNGKKAFKANYWKCVLVGLILFVVAGGVSFTLGYNSGAGTGSSAYDSINNNLSAAFTITNGFLALGMSIFVLAVTILLLNPALVGCSNFFLHNRKDPTTGFSPLGLAFSEHYGNIVKTMFMQDLFIMLWALLLVIPGIVKSYQYRLVPFILCEKPDMDYKEALQLSKKLMNGSKWRAFVLDLSWFGWALLAGLTFGILGVFYVIPYDYATEAELYVALAHPEQSHRVGLAVPDAQTVDFETKEN